MIASDRESSLKLTGWLIHLAGIGTLASSVALYHWLVSSYVVREQEAIAAETAEKERYVSTKDIVEQDLEQYTRRLDELKENAVTMRQRIPEQPQEAEFLRQISQVADEEGLKIIKYGRGSLLNKKTHFEFDVRLSGEGNYSAICGFLDRLAKLSRVATVQSLTLNSGTGEVYPFELSLLLYYGAQGSQKSG